MATKPMGQLGGTPRVVAMQPKCHPAQQVGCLELLAEVCQNSTSCAHLVAVGLVECDVVTGPNS